MPGDDIDDRGERIGAVGGGVGPADDLDVVDVVHGQRQFIPGYAAQGRLVDRAAVDQHLHLARKAVGQRVVADRLGVAAVVIDDEAGRQSQQVGDFGKTGCDDHLPVDDGRCHRRIGLGLRQAGGRQYKRQVVEEGVFGEQCFVGLRAGDHGGAREQQAGEHRVQAALQSVDGVTTIAARTGDLASKHAEIASFWLSVCAMRSVRC